MLHIKGAYLLSVTSEDIDLLDRQSRKSVMRWPFHLLRQYGRNKQEFNLVAGRRCPSGPGLFCFKTNHYNAIFHEVETNIQSLEARARIGSTSSTSSHKIANSNYVNGPASPGVPTVSSVYDGHTDAKPTIYHQSGEYSKPVQQRGAYLAMKPAGTSSTSSHKIANSNYVNGPASPGVPTVSSVYDGHTDAKPTIYHQSGEYSKPVQQRGAYLFMKPAGTSSTSSHKIANSNHVNRQNSHKIANSNYVNGPASPGVPTVSSVYDSHTDAKPTINSQSDEYSKPVQQRGTYLFMKPADKTKLISSQAKFPGAVAQHICPPIYENLEDGRPDLSAQYSRLNIGGQHIAETEYDSISYPSNNQWPVEDGAYSTISNAPQGNPTADDLYNCVLR